MLILALLGIVTAFMYVYIWAMLIIMWVFKALCFIVPLVVLVLIVVKVYKHFQK
jgi:hypothetical protein